MAVFASRSLYLPFKATIIRPPGTVARNGSSGQASVLPVILVLVLVLVVDERGSFSAVGAHIFPSFIKTVLEDVD